MYPYINSTDKGCSFQVAAYKSYQESASADNCLDFQSWITLNRNTIPQFQYWSMVLELELLVMQFVHSLRTADFDTYVQCIGQLTPWFFTFDHTNYSRWVSVHVRDMLMLPQTAPTVYEEFKKGNFVVQKSSNVFSAMAMDQAHEQMNDVIKGDGGVIGITNNPSALLKWTTACPEIARIVAYCKLMSLLQTSKKTATLITMICPNLFSNSLLNIFTTWLKNFKKWVTRF